MKTIGQTACEMWNTVIALDGFGIDWDRLDEAGKERWEKVAISVAERIVSAEHTSQLDIVEEESFVECRNKATMGEHVCDNPSQCWEPCGELGNDPRHVRACSPQMERDVNRALGLRQ